MEYILNLRDPVSFLIQNILVFIKVWTEHLKILKKMTYQCVTELPQTHVQSFKLSYTVFIYQNKFLEDGLEKK